MADVESIIEKVEQYKRQLDVAEGARAQLMTSLREFGVSTVEEAESLLENTKKSLVEEQAYLESIEQRLVSLTDWDKI